MYTDAQNRPSNNQSIVGTGTIVSTDCIDLLSANRNIGRNVPMRAVVTLTTALAGGSVRAELIESANANLSSPTVLSVGPTVAAGAAAGFELLDVPIPDTAKRYLGFQYVITGTTTTGTVFGGIVAGTDRRVNEIAMVTGL
jgi:hypothetical protein